MSTTWRSRMMGFGLLTLGVVAGAGGAVAAGAVTPGFLDTGLFTVRPGEHAIFSVSLDAAPGSASAPVLLQFLDESGVVTLQQNALLDPGQSTALSLTADGRYRAHARFLDQPRAFGVRRRVVGTVEVGVDDVAIPPRWVCSIDDSVPSVRPG